MNLSVGGSIWGLINNIVVLIIASIGFAYYEYNSAEPSYFESALIETFAPIQSTTTSAQSYLSQVIDQYILIVNTRKQNTLLKKKILKLEGDVFFMSELERENKRLKALLEFGKEIPRKKVLAGVIGEDSQSGYKVIRINKGTNSGISIKDPVITSSGVVGHIYRATPNYADIMTLLDQNNRIDAIVARTRSHGIMEGISKDSARLKYVARTEAVEAGDVIITAGLGLVYPKGLKLGTISKVDREKSGITQSIEITPAVNFNKLEEVVVYTKEQSSVVDTEEKQ